MEAMTKLTSGIEDEDAAESKSSPKVSDLDVSDLLQVIRKNLDKLIGRRKVNLRERRELCKRGKRILAERHAGNDIMTGASVIISQLRSELDSEGVTLSDDELYRFLDGQSSRKYTPEIIIIDQLEKVIANTEIQFETWDDEVEEATQISGKWPDMLLPDLCRVALLLNEEPQSFFQEEWKWPKPEDNR